MENINKKAFKKQQLVFFLILTIIAVVVIAGIFYFKSQSSTPKKEKVVPNFVGVVNQTFDGKYSENILKDSQKASRETSKQYKEVIESLDKTNKELDSLKKALKNEKNEKTELEQLLNNKIIELENRLNNKSINIELSDNFNHPKKGNGLVSNNYLQPKILTSVSLNQSLTMKVTDLPYIPSGSFAEATIIEGADANASVTGNNNTDPVQFRLTGKIQMPNDEEFDATGCFITGEIYGDISSERGKVRTHSMSCKMNNKTVDMKIKGHVSFMGKNGIKGVPIMRNGKIIAWAGAAGFLDGLGKGAESASGTTVGIGATASASGGDILKSALGGGVSTSANALSNYYIKRAEQYHPIIEIGAGNEVTVMFQDGFQLEYIEDKKVKGSLNANQNNNKDLINYKPQYTTQNQYQYNQKTESVDEETKKGYQDSEIKNEENNSNADKGDFLKGLKFDDFIQ